jgi:flagellar motor switch protein FliN
MAGEQLNPAELEQLLSQVGGSAAAAGPGPENSGGRGPSDPDALLQAVSGGPDAQASAARVGQPSASPARASSAESDLGMASGDVEYLLAQAEMALASVNEPVGMAADLPIKPFPLQDFSGAAPSGEAATLALIRDVELDVKIELGRTQMYLEDVLRLHKGSVVALDKLAGDPVDIFVNGRLIARGEVLVLNDNFCVRVAELVAGETVT